MLTLRGPFLLLVEIQTDKFSLGPVNMLQLESQQEKLDTVRLRRHAGISCCYLNCQRRWTPKKNKTSPNSHRGRCTHSQTDGQMVLKQEIPKWMKKKGSGKEISVTQSNYSRVVEKWMKTCYKPKKIKKYAPFPKLVYFICRQDHRLSICEIQ